jgi:hypothetical protein
MLVGRMDMGRERECLLFRCEGEAENDVIAVLGFWRLEFWERVEVTASP